MSLPHSNFFVRDFAYEGVLVENEAADQIDLKLDDGRVLSLEEVLIYHLGYRVGIALHVLTPRDTRPEGGSDGR